MYKRGDPVVPVLLFVTRCGIAGSCGYSVFDFWMSHQIFFQSKCTILRSYQNHPPASLTSLLVLYEVVFHCGSAPQPWFCVSRTFLTPDDIRRLLVCLSAVVSLRGCPATTFARLEAVTLLLSCMLMYFEFMSFAHMRVGNMLL